jgi:hypothetical protein
MALTKRAELFNRMTQRGVYDVTSIGDHPGAIFFVSSEHVYASDAAGFGKSPDSPVATIDYAVSLCTASAGDVIYVMPQHSETVDGAAALDLDVAGIHLIGIGEGTIMPILEMTADAATVAINAANVTVENFHIVSNTADVTFVFDVNFDDFTLRHCRFTQAGDNLTFRIGVQDAGAFASDRITVEDCHAIMYDALTTHFVNFGGTGDGHIVRRNVLIGDWSTMAIGGAGVVTLAAVQENYIYSAGNDGDSAINFADTATGIVADNRSGILGSADGVDCIIMSTIENYHVNIADGQGILDPAAT